MPAPPRRGRWKPLFFASKVGAMALAHRACGSHLALGAALLVATAAMALAAAVPTGRGSSRVAGSEAGAPSRPASIDLRPNFKAWGLAPRRQGGRGTCSVFTVTGAIEYALAKRDGGRGTHLSVEYLNWASNDAIRHQADGGFFSDLWKGYLRHGICPEADMPYQAEYDPKLRPSDAARQSARELRRAGLRLRWIKEWDVKTGLTDEQFLAIKDTLIKGWPVCGGFRWPKKERWDKSADGGAVLRMAAPADVFDGHSVLLVGYRDDAALPGGGAFLIRNSGGGEADAALPYAYVRAYMNDAAWIAPADEPSPSTRPAPARAAMNSTNPVLAMLSPLVPPPAGRNQRCSSNEQPNWHDANMDMRWLMPGESVEMPIFEGPGLITHMWFTSHAGWAGELNALVLRIYWDGEETPGVEAPLGDFFAVGHGRPAPVESVPVQVSPSGSLSCCWRMPFRSSARIVVTNDNPDRSTGLYWQVDWMRLDEPLPAETPYFYARYRQEHPAPSGRDYRFADLEGAGFYVGTVLSVTLAQDGWFGEGDDFFYVDGEEVPSLQGTGTEDYFNDAWGFRARTGPWFGQPRWQGYRAGDSGVCYRWHLPDPVYFKSSLVVDVEHKGNADDSLDGFYIERPDFFSSVAFWYQVGAPKAWPALPAWHQRRVPWEVHHCVKAFRQVRVSGATNKPRIQTTGFFGARPMLEWAGAAPGSELTIPFRIAEEGRYAVRLTAGSSPEAGTYDVLLDGKVVHTFDGRAAESGEADVLLGTHALAKGEHAISFKPTAGAAAAAAERSGPLVIETLRTLRLPPEAKRAVRDHNEAHFVRLGIGRAVYAYRLAHDKLPESLQTLVEAGIMPERFLRDENGRPLASRVEDGHFVVESPAPNGWRHRWQGLDARR